MLLCFNQEEVEKQKCGNLERHGRSLGHLAGLGSLLLHLHQLLGGGLNGHTETKLGSVL